MKTTAGKTKAPPQGERLVYIKALEPSHRGVVAQFNAKSLKDGLKQFAERMYVPKGWQYKIVGNTMQVFKGDTVRNYRALETYQSS